MEEKKCVTCNKSKILDEFNANKKHKDGKQPSCRECTKLWSKQHYVKNKENIKTGIQKLKDQRKDYILNVKKNSNCLKCNENRFYMLDFHHTDSNEKEFNISELANKNLSWEKTKNEIEKCIILCRNCHTEFHYLERKDGITIKDYINN
jgi:hypothetical protein